MSDKTTHWRTIVARYQTPQTASAVWQLLNSIVPYLLLWYLMTRLVRISYPLALLVAILTAGFWVRIFIISHDCGHGSFFASRRANRFWGVLTAVLTLTPYQYWRREHAIHHASSGNLDRRGVGDIWTMTVQEYRGSPRWKRAAYRVYRNPFVMFGIGPVLLFTFRYRFPARVRGRPEQRSVHWTNLGLLSIAAIMIAWIGLRHYMMILLPMMTLAAGVGVWLFYVQHQFEGVYWARDDEWDYLKQATQGSSFYRLPRVLQWFSGNIGFHHVHHLSHRIPNYRLEQCHNENDLFRQVPPVTLLSSLKSLRLRLWDEERHKLVGFGALRRQAAGGPASAAT